MTHLPVSLVALTHLKSIGLPVSQMVFPPADVAVKDAEAIKMHLSCAERKETEIHEPESTKTMPKNTVSQKGRKRKKLSPVFEELNIILNRPQYEKSRVALEELFPDIREALM